MFAIIFIFEMVVKLLAMGLIWGGLPSGHRALEDSLEPETAYFRSGLLLTPGEDAYLKSAWNWLDGIVVMVSIINMAACPQRCSRQ